MTQDQTILFAILGVLFALLIWGRWRYDMVAFAALVVALIVGVVPVDRAFSGFGHPATVVIALVLIISRGLSNSGVVEWVAARFVDASRALFAHIGIMATVAAALSAVMNNVAALALLMPVDLEAASRAKRSPALTLMPLSFASILGGLVTLIGTPPNIIIASFRDTSLGEPFGMFDFAPVGLICAVTGVIFVALIGWRLIPAARSEKNIGQEMFELGDYVAELKVGEKSKAIGKPFEELVEGSDVSALATLRDGVRLPVRSRGALITGGDVIVVQGGPEAIEKFAGSHGLDYVDTDQGPGAIEASDLEMREAVVPNGSAIEGRSALSIGLLRFNGVSLLGISRQGERFRQRVRALTIQAGDVLLMLGAPDAIDSAIRRTGVLPLAERGLHVMQREKAGLAVGIFAFGILLASFGFLYLAVALAAVVVAYAFFNIVPLREVYDSIEWPVIVLLGSLIPIGEALETSGGTTLIAGGLLTITQGQPAPIVLLLFMVVTMTLSDVLNNTATALIAAPIALEIAARLGVNPDAFLMAVA
ncbi:MAG: SLC13 family permease, partial [Pseudomonadota bacterium]